MLSTSSRAVNETNGVQRSGVDRRPLLTDHYMTILERKIRDVVKEEVSKSMEAVVLKLHSVENHISDVNNNVKMMSSGTELNSSKSMKRSIMEKKIEFFQAIYDKKLTVHVTEKCVIGRACKLLFYGTQGTLVEKTAFLLKSMLFARLPQDKKSEFLTKPGQQYCSLRRSMARTALSHVEKTSSTDFAQSRVPVLGEET